MSNIITQKNTKTQAKALPKRNAFLRVVQALDGSEDVRQGMGRVPADESNDDPRSQQRRLGTPALFGEVTENRAGNGQQTQETQNNPEHRRDPPTSALNTHYLGARKTETVLIKTQRCSKEVRRK